MIFVQFVEDPRSLILFFRKSSHCMNVLTFLRSELERWSDWVTPSDVSIPIPTNSTPVPTKHATTPLHVSPCDHMSDTVSPSASAKNACASETLQTLQVRSGLRKVPNCRRSCKQ